MSAVDTILFALKAHFRREVDPTAAAVNVLADYEATTIGRLRDFTPVWTRSDGSDVPATELRCIPCGHLVQAVGVKTLLDINALASSHNCQSRKADA
ncbi:hypothetical protein F8R89_30755 [Streptomyces sp. SS1-1]|uniref:hypothetical protein n=1 Tax=Streptomyces sp. SS1-1 TaxID=2651869 RepID=UPI0012504E05|nr:hypothetical protein [Streptomyces sp. SS1-1]KAB2975990.1 hypothetical protein F8R89_30755 [Streptomyces sp. SS1-1]